MEGGREGYLGFRSPMNFSCSCASGMAQPCDWPASEAEGEGGGIRGLRSHQIQWGRISFQWIHCSQIQRQPPSLTAKQWPKFGPQTHVPHVGLASYSCGSNTQICHPPHSARAQQEETPYYFIISSTFPLGGGGEIQYLDPIISFVCVGTGFIMMMMMRPTKPSRQSPLLNSVYILRGLIAFEQ